MISINPYLELSNAVRDELERHIYTEFGHLDFIVQLQWSSPEYAVRKLHNGQLLCFYNIVLREISLDGNSFQAMGISNLITPEVHRGNRFAFDLLSKTQEQMLNHTGSNIGLLLCSEAMLPFYQRLGWAELHCAIYHEQPTGRKLWPAKAMIFAPGRFVVKGSELLLNGPPW